MINILKERLSKFFSKILVEDQGAFVSLLLYHRGEPKYLVCIPKRSRFIYAKLVDIEEASSLECIATIYDPRGLYAFAKNIDELVEKILAKTGVSI